MLLKPVDVGFRTSTQPTRSAIILQRRIIVFQNRDRRNLLAKFGIVHTLVFSTEVRSPLPVPSTIALSTTKHDRTPLTPRSHLEFGMVRSQDESWVGDGDCGKECTIQERSHCVGDRRSFEVPQRQSHSWMIQLGIVPQPNLRLVSTAKQKVSIPIQIQE